MTDMFRGDDAGLIELKPCPFDAGEPQRCQNFEGKRGEAMFWVLCKKCHASPGDFPTQEQADAAWNRRPTDDASLVKGEDRDALAYRVANRRQGQSSTPRCEEPGQADIDSARRLVDLVLDEVATLPPSAMYMLTSGLKARNIDVSGATDPVTAALVAISHCQAERAGNPLACVASVEVAARGAGQGEADWRSAMRGLMDVWHRQAAAIEKDAAKAVPAADVRLSRVRAALLDRVASDLKLTMACVASPPLGGWKPDREAVARLCAPDVFLNAELAVKWENLDKPRDRWWSPGMAVRLVEVQDAYDRADDILALPAAPLLGEG